MSIAELASAAFKKAVELNIALKKHSSHSICVGSAQFTPATFSNKIDLFFENLPVEDEFSQIDPAYYKVLRKRTTDFFVYLRREIDKQAVDESKKSIEEVGEIVFRVGFADEDSRIKDLEFVREQDNGSKIYVYCKPRGTTARLDRAVFESELNLLPKELRPIVLSRILIGSTTFHPSLPQGLIKVTDAIKNQHWITTDKVLNTYKIPAWKSEYEEPRLHPTIKKLIEFLFVGEGCQKHMYRWIYSLLYTSDKPMPIIVMFSQGGLGKGRFFDALLCSMVGFENYQKPPETQHGRFDNFYTICHLFYSAEAKLNSRNIPRFKEIYDGYITSERKGVDVGKPKRVCVKVALSSNDPADLYMTYDARKFTVPDMRKDAVLKEHLSEDELNFLEDFKLNFKEQAAFAAWIRDNFEPLKYEEVWHGDTFKYLCEYHLEGWFKTFRAMLEKNKQISHDELRDNLSGSVKSLSVEKLLSVLNKYQTDTKTTICEVVPSPDGLDVGVIYNSKIFGG